MTKIFLSLFFYAVAATGMMAQSYTSYFTGNPNNVDVEPVFGLCLMGGGGESDEAMIWFLERANGGDVLVLRASGADGYNDYLYSDLGVSVNSVETIVFNSAEAANDPYVIDKVNNAEAIWMAGGDQSDYVNYWQGTAIEEGINNLINVKQGPLGGISAGMAVLGQAYFSAAQGTITQEQALADPFAPQMQISWDDFIEAPFLENTITETHFNDPDRIRYGRIFSFMARIQFDQGIRPLGIASNEYCAIAIDEFGVARAFGEFPEFDDDYVYFLQPNCEGPQGPEVIQQGLPLTWNRNGEAVKVYKVPATLTGENSFDLTDWNTGSGGIWEDWYAIEGSLTRTASSGNPNCILRTTERSASPFRLYPNPASTEIQFEMEFEGSTAFQIIDPTGRVVKNGFFQAAINRIEIADLDPGIYRILTQQNQKLESIGFLKIR